jgi:hypothetical protein
MVSKIKVDEIEESTGSAGVTLKSNTVIDTGKTFTITDGLATSAITSGTIADARISESSITQYIVPTDITPLQHDILTLALHSAVADNKAAHNLSSAFIDQFEDDTGIGTETTVDRHSSEYVFAEAATGTLISVASVPATAKTKVTGVLLYKDAAGTATLGTDLKIYFTCDGGSNWTEAASYTAVTPTFSTGIKMVKLGETTCTSGSDIRYKAVWANQASGSKETQVYGMAIDW